jgi:hypothetical protein
MPKHPRYVEFQGWTREELVAYIDQLEHFNLFAGRIALLEALEDVINRYESANEHDNTHYRTLRALAEALENA